MGRGRRRKEDACGHDDASGGVAPDLRAEREADYRDRLLEYSDLMLGLSHERAMQSASMTIAVITFVFLFEVEIVAAGFPKSMSGFAADRYAPCVSLLLSANFYLTLALCLCLKALSAYRTPLPEESDYFPPRDSDLRVELQAIHYAISSTFARNVHVAGKVVHGSRRYAAFGAVLGALSFVVFLWDAGALAKILGTPLPALTQVLPGWAWLLVATGAFVRCVHLFRAKTRRLDERFSKTWYPDDASSEKARVPFMVSEAKSKQRRYREMCQMEAGR